MKSMKKLQKWCLCLVALCCTLLGGQAKAQTSDTSSYLIDIDNDHVQDYRIETGGWTTKIKPTVSTNAYEHATYTHYQYQKSGQLFRLTLVRLENGSMLYFAHHASSGKAEQVPLRITVFDPVVQQTAALISTPDKNWKKGKQIPSSFSYPLYIDGERLFSRIGKTDEYTPLGYTVHQQIPQKERSATYVKNGNTHTFSLSLYADKKTIGETWGMISPQPLIRWDNEQAVAKAALLEFEYDKKLRLDGAYYTNEPTYRPYAPLSFYRNPANGDGLRALSFLAEEENGAFFKNVATHLAYASVKTQNTSGYWETQPRSEWLYKEYGIGYHYMDNRRNADNATFLLRFNQALPDASVQRALQKWNTYFAYYMKTHGLKTGEEGIFLPDYVGSKHTKRTHTSLNHQVATMNYLYEAYLYDQDEDKKNMADKLFAGIEETKTRWVMPNHNLYYALYPNLKPHPYPDYPYLTRDDLLLSQYFMFKIQGEPHPTLQFLLDNKNEWLENGQK
jgi:hypothetical protein